LCQVFRWLGTSIAKMQKAERFVNRLGVEKSASQHLSQTEIGGDNARIDSYPVSRIFDGCFSNAWLSIPTLSHS
jgi:hypothetical protein